MQQRESLRLQCAADEQAKPGDVAARPVEARDQAKLNGVVAEREDDRDGSGFSLRGEH